MAGGQPGDVTRRGKLISSCLPRRNNRQTIFITPLVDITSSPTFLGRHTMSGGFRAADDDEDGIGNRRPRGEARDVSPERA